MKPAVARRKSLADRNRGLTSWLVFAAAIGFLGGMLVMAAIVAVFPSGAASVADAPVEAASGQAVASPPPAKVHVKPSLKEIPPAVTAPEASATPAISMAAGLTATS